MILLINAGSSSLKYSLYDRSLHVVLKGLIEEITSYEKAFETLVLHVKKEVGEYIELDAIAHRVVHGGEYFNQPTVINDEVENKIEELIALAPLHNGANLKGIKMCDTFFNGVKQIAVFDTAFHQSMPPYAYRYPIEKPFYEELHVRKYGFHGTSHEYLLSQTAKVLKKEVQALNIITLHIGNGVSACAIKAGKSVDTTMGLTPLEGLMMGSRCGSIDPAIAFYLMREADMSSDEVLNSFNKKSGLKGIGNSSDMRRLLALRKEGDKEATLAIEMYTYRIKKAIGEYMAVLGRVDAIVFSGGIGENSSDIRAEVCEGLEPLGISINATLNCKNMPCISDTDANVKLLVIATDEEYQMALHVKQMLLSHEE